MTPPASGCGATNGSGSGAAAAVLIVVADATLSLVADTLTLPRVIRKRHVDQGTQGKVNPAGSEKEKTAGQASTDVSLGMPLPLAPSARAE